MIRVWHVMLGILAVSLVLWAGVISLALAVAKALA